MDNKQIKNMGQFPPNTDTTQNNLTNYRQPQNNPGISSGQFQKPNNNIPGNSNNYPAGDNRVDQNYANNIVINQPGKSGNTNNMGNMNMAEPSRSDNPCCFCSGGK